MTFPKRQLFPNSTPRANNNLEQRLHEICKRNFTQFCKKYDNLEWEPIDTETAHVPSFYLPKYGLDERRDKVTKVVKSKAFQRLTFTRNEALLDQQIAHPNLLNSLLENTHIDGPVENKENSSSCTPPSPPLQIMDATEETTTPRTLEYNNNEIEFNETFQNILDSQEQLTRLQHLEEKTTEDL
ncbi:unnamed protein product [Rodentolepis nana]|uniref:Uncharacterized protein n=1 Tax=Rodentolepis nana TaxID=102285 RepID=A0A0R3TJ87_RODNA|nr:unnamed protein product [Rodentolepis nana]